MTRYHYVMSNEFGIKENPILPGLSSILPVPSSGDPVMWKPAFYLLILVFCMILLALRGQTINFLVPLIPLLFQTGVMILVNYARDFRYMFSTELSALFAIGLLFLPLAELQKARDSQQDNKQEHD